VVFPSPSAEPVAVNSTVGSDGSTVVVAEFGSLPSAAEVAWNLLAQVKAEAPLLSPLQVQADLTFASSPLPGLGREYRDTASYPTLFVVFLDSSVSASSSDAGTAGFQLSIAEQLNFSLAVTLRGLSALAVQVQLPQDSNGEPFLDVEAVGVELGTGIVAQELAGSLQIDNATGLVTWSDSNVSALLEGDLTAADVVVLTLVTRVSLEQRVVAGLGGEITYRVDFAALTEADTEAVQVLSPELLQIVEVPVLTGDAGDTLPLDVDIRHQLATSSFAAFEVNVVVSVGRALTLVAADGPLLLLPDGIPFGLVSSFAKSQVSLTVPVLGLNQTLRLRMNVTVDATVGAGQQHTINVRTVFATRAAAPRRFVFLDDTRVFQADALAPPSTVLLFSTGNFSREGQALVTFGEELRTSSRVVLAEGTLSGFRLALAFPAFAGETVVRVRNVTLVNVGAQLSLPAFQVIPLSVDVRSNLARREAVDPLAFAHGVEVLFGNVSNVADNVVDAGDAFEVEVTAEVLVSSSVRSGNRLDLTVGPVDGSLGESAALSLLLALPDLQAVATYADVREAGSGAKLAVLTVVFEHGQQSLLHAEGVESRFTFGGNTSRSVTFRDTAGASNGTRLELGEQLVSSHTLVVNEAVLQPGDQVCVQVEVNFTSPRLGADGAVPLSATLDQCFDVVVSAASGTPFFGEARNVLIVVVSVVVLLVLVAVVATRRSAKKRKPRKHEGPRDPPYWQPQPSVYTGPTMARPYEELKEFPTGDYEEPGSKAHRYGTRLVSLNSGRSGSGSWARNAGEGERGAGEEPARAQAAAGD
jgi:hypothetical protein